MDAVDPACEVFGFVGEHVVKFTCQQDLSVVYFTEFVDPLANLSISGEIQRVDFLLATNRPFDCLAGVHSERDPDLVVGAEDVLDSGVARVSIEVVGALQSANCLNGRDKYTVGNLLPSRCDF